MTPEERAAALFTTGIDREMGSNGYSACAWVALGSKLMCYCDADEEALAAKVRELAAPFAAAIRAAVDDKTSQCARLCDAYKQSATADRAAYGGGPIEAVAWEDGRIAAAIDLAGAIRGGDQS